MPLFYSKLFTENIIKYHRWLNILNNGRWIESNLVDLCYDLFSRNMYFCLWQFSLGERSYKAGSWREQCSGVNDRNYATWLDPPEGFRNNTLSIITTQSFKCRYRVFTDTNLNIATPTDALGRLCNLGAYCWLQSYSRHVFFKFSVAIEYFDISRYFS